MPQFGTRNRREYVSSRLRLRDYDYSQPAFYFVSICCNNRVPLFGSVVKQRMVPNPAGMMLQKLWDDLPNDFRGISLDCQIIMPNHVHLLIGIGTRESDPIELTSLIDVIHWYKSLSTTRYIRGVKDAGWPRFEGRLWQERFHDHIVRNDRELSTIRDYIIHNPERWDEDTYRI